MKTSTTLVSLLFSALYASAQQSSTASSSESSTTAPSSFLYGTILIPAGASSDFLAGATNSPTNTDSSAPVSSGAVLTTTSMSGNSTNTTMTMLASSETGTALVGTVGLNATATSTGTAASATNTTPCNGHPEFCNRLYSNITYIAAHNSPFVRPGNAASNQAIPVIGQLNDGIRMVTSETHFYNNDMYVCHTSCDLLNAGTVTEWLTNITQWLAANPYEVVSVLLVNSDFVSVENYTAPIHDSGLINYAYYPPYQAMGLTQWPTLGEMIVKNQRAVIIMDYNANETAVPYILNEYAQMAETVFSPTNQSFPCDISNPSGLTEQLVKGRLIVANHNLNVEIGTTGILIPATTIENVTNAVTGFGSLGLMALDTCVALWNRSPNFLIVDYYNEGTFDNGSYGIRNGSVFQVAALANNVTYTGDCCGTDLTVQSAAQKISISIGALLLAAMAALLVYA